MTKREYIEQATLAFFANPAPQYTLETIGDTADQIYGNGETTFALPVSKDKFLINVRIMTLAQRADVRGEVELVDLALETMWNELTKEK